MEIQVRNKSRSAGTANTTNVRPSSFVQQGTVDWVALGNESLTASVSILRRPSGCGAEPLTASVACVIRGTLRLSASGTSHLNEALEKLNSFGTYGNSMYFGFGVKSIVRTLAEIAEGMSAVAICASAAEVHGLAVSTQIIHEYINLYRADSDTNLMPSYRQWEALVNVSLGVYLDLHLDPS